MNKIKIIIDPTDKHIDEYYSYCLRKSIFNTWMVLFYILMFIFISLGIEDKVIGNFIFAILWIGIFIVLIYFSARKKRNAAKMLLKNSTLYYEINDNNITVKNEKQDKTIIDYNLVSKVLETENLFVIHCNNNLSAFLIPKKSLSEKDIESFKKIISVSVPKKINKLK